MYLNTRKYDQNLMSLKRRENNYGKFKEGEGKKGPRTVGRMGVRRRCSQVTQPLFTPSHLDQTHSQAIRETYLKLTNQRPWCKRIANLPLPMSQLSTDWSLRRGYCWCWSPSTFLGRHTVVGYMPALLRAGRWRHTHCARSSVPQGHRGSYRKQNAVQLLRHTSPNTIKRDKTQVWLPAK